MNEQDPMRVVDSNPLVLDDIEDKAVYTARWAQEAVEAARTIRDRASAARRRGLRVEDISAIREAQTALTAAQAMLTAGNDELRERTATLWPALTTG